MSNSRAGMPVVGWLPEDEYVYWWAASTFGWTPAQVDAVPGRLLTWMRSIDSVMPKPQRFA